MPEQDFTNREIKHYFDEITKTLDRIEVQVMKTNGRVSKLELWKESIMAKISVAAAGIAIMWMGVKEFILNK